MGQTFLSASCGHSCPHDLPGKNAHKNRQESTFCAIAVSPRTRALYVILSGTPRRILPEIPRPDASPSTARHDVKQALTTMMQKVDSCLPRIVGRFPSRRVDSNRFGATGTSSAGRIRDIQEYLSLQPRWLSNRQILWPRLNLRQEMGSIGDFFTSVHLPLGRACPASAHMGHRGTEDTEHGMRKHRLLSLFHLCVLHGSVANQAFCQEV